MCIVNIQMSKAGLVPEVTPLIQQAASSVTVESVDNDIFKGPKSLLYKPPLARGVYGGQVIGQALMAAANTVPPEIPVHSFHCYFLQSGDPDRDIVYTCKRLRDGRAFFTRSVTASQKGVAIFILVAQFHIHEPSRGLLYHDPMPDVYKPSELIDIYEYWQSIEKHPGLDKHLRDYIEKAQKRPVSIDQKIVHKSFLKNDDRFREELIPHLWPLMVGNGKPQRLIWMKSHSSLEAVPNVHKCVIAYMSDMSFISTAMEPLHAETLIGKPPRVAMTVSLDHSMWFHPPENVELRADEWLLFGMTCHVAGKSRALLNAKVWNQSGDLVVSVSQEALIRLAPGNVPPIPSKL